MRNACQRRERYLFFFFLSTIPNTCNSVFWPFTIMSVDFEEGSVKAVRACLHLVTSCVLSDLKSIWFVTFGHIKNAYKSDLELGLPHYHVKEINRYALHFIHHQPIKRSKIATWESGISSGKILYFQFHSRQFARRLAGCIRGDACSAVISDYYLSYSL